MDIMFNVGCYVLSHSAILFSETKLCLKDTEIQSRKNNGWIMINKQNILPFSRETVMNKRKLQYVRNQFLWMTCSFWHNHIFNSSFKICIQKIVITNDWLNCGF